MSITVIKSPHSGLLKIKIKQTSEANKESIAETGYKTENIPEIIPIKNEVE